MISFSPKQAENIKADISGIEFEMNEGTIRSGKTNSDIFKMARIYAQSPDRDHLVLAYNQEQAYRMFIDGEGFGLMYIFADNSEIRHNENGDHLWINFGKGNEKRIYYKGGGKVNQIINGMYSYIPTPALYKNLKATFPSAKAIKMYEEEMTKMYRKNV